MSASIDVIGLAGFSRSMRKVIAGDLQKNLVKSIQTAGPKMVGEMHSSARTRIQRQAVGSVSMHNVRDGIDLEGGRGSSLGAVLFDGGEYGGRNHRKRTYATRSPRGRAYIVSRRVTMQFLPHLGHEGYFFWPTVRDWMVKLSKEQDALVEKALR